MLEWLKIRAETWQNAEKLYFSVVNQSRLPAFFLDLTINDSMRGRFELLAMHMFLLLDRLKREDEAEDLAQFLTDIFIKDIERAYRDIGIGEMGIPKRMKKMGKLFASRLQIYSDLVKLSDAEAQCDMMIDKIFVHEGQETRELIDPSKTVALVTYLLGAQKMLRSISVEDLKNGQVKYPSLG